MIRFILADTVLLLMKSTFEEQNDGFGPLAERRGKSATYASIAVLIILTACLFASVFVSEPHRALSPRFYALAFAISCLAALAGEIIRRACLFAEEYKHIESRYGGNILTTLKATFAIENTAFVVVVVVLASLILVYDVAVGAPVVTCPEYVCLLCISSCVVPLAFHVFGLRNLAPVEMSCLEEQENMNVADGLAWSYYYGYLKLVLPSLHRVIQASEEYGSKIKVKKLFILLPKNCFCYGTISECDERVVAEGNLPELSVDRAGILQRRYKQTVYRIDVPLADGTGGVQAHYCIVEYATPLLSLYEMSMNPEAGMSKEKRDRQCMAFVRKLNKILDDFPDTHGKYQLVLLSGKGNNVADSLLKYLVNDTCL